jgi:hypothetical protein
MQAPRTLLVALLVSVLASPIGSSAGAESERSRPGPRFQGWTPLSDYVSTGLREGGSLRLTLPSRRGNQEWALRPVPVHADDYGAEVTTPDGERRGRGGPKVRTFAGHPALEDGSGRRPGGDFVRLAREPSGRLSGLSRVDGVLYDLSAESGDLVLQLREVLPEEIGLGPSACATGVEAAAPSPEPTAPTPLPPAAASALLEIELGTEADADFVDQVGGVEAANARILSIVNAINGIYETDLGLTNRVVFQRAWDGSDPYSSSDSGVLLSEFRSDFLAGVATPTDDAQLFSGRDFEGSTVGRAYVSAACGSARFGVNQYYNQNDAITRLIAAHEMGHNLGGGHTADGIMAPSINSAVTWFSAESQSEIGSFVNSVSCLTEPAGGSSPTLEPIGPQSVRENETLAFSLDADDPDDPDGGALVYAASPLPPGASLSAGGAFQWRPALDSVGCGGFSDHAVTFSVTDPQGNRASEVVVISVLDAPSGAAPVFAPVADRSVLPGRPLSIPLAAQDADGDTVTFSAVSLPAGASLSPSGLLRWTPAASQLGDHPIDLTARDCTGQSGGTSLTVDVATTAPVLEALSSTSGNKGDLLTITGQNFTGKKVKVFFGPKKRKAKRVTATSLVVKVPKKKKKIIGDDVPVTIWRDGVVSINEIVFTYTTPTR